MLLNQVSLFFGIAREVNIYGTSDLLVIVFSICITLTLFLSLFLCFGVIESSGNSLLASAIWQRRNSMIFSGQWTMDLVKSFDQLYQLDPIMLVRPLSTDEDISLYWSF